MRRLRIRLRERGRKVKRLTANLRTLLLMGVSRAGSYNPDDVLPSVEEMMTGPEVVAAEGFLSWLFTNGLTAGHGNIDSRWAEYAKSKGGTA
jgi:hypothetical protein